MHLIFSSLLVSTFHKGRHFSSRLRSVLWSPFSIPSKWDKNSLSQCPRLTMEMLLFCPGTLEEMSSDLPAHWKNSTGLDFRKQIKSLLPSHPHSVTVYPGSCIYLGSSFSHSSMYNNCGHAMAIYQVKKWGNWGKSEVRRQNAYVTSICTRHLDLAVVWAEDQGTDPVL